MLLKVSRGLGEICLLLPIIGFCTAIGLGFPCMLSTVCLMAYKPLYSTGFHFCKGKGKWCIIMSYGVLAGITLLYAGLTVFVPFMANQPMALVLMLIGVSLLSANGGQWRDEVIEYRRINAFDIDRCTKEQLTERCRLHRLSAEETRNATLLFVTMRGSKAKEYMGFLSPPQMEAEAARKVKSRLKGKILGG